MPVLRLETARLHQRDANGNMEILAPRTRATKVKLGLPQGESTPVSFMQSIWEHDGLDIELRFRAAQAAMGYVHAKLHLLLPPNPPERLSVVISGGLPPMPGSSTLMPSKLPSPRTLVDRELEQPAPAGARGEPASAVVPELEPLEEPGGF
jgi:hypothetical protein